MKKPIVFVCLFVAGLVVILGLADLFVGSWTSSREEIITDGWGYLPHPGLYELQRDALLDGHTWAPALYSGTGSYNADDVRENKVMIAGGEASAYIVPKGTRFRLSRMTYDNRITHLVVKVYATVLTGEDTGMRVEITPLVTWERCAHAKVRVTGFRDGWIRQVEPEGAADEEKPAR